jgi:hypothetical protein
LNEVTMCCLIYINSGKREIYVFDYVFRFHNRVTDLSEDSCGTWCIALTRGICHSCSSLFWAIYLYSSSFPEVALKWDESQNKNDPLMLFSHPHIQPILFTTKSQCDVRNSKIKTYTN